MAALRSYSGFGDSETPGGLGTIVVWKWKLMKLFFFRHNLSFCAGQIGSPLMHWPFVLLALISESHMIATYH